MTFSKITENIRPGIFSFLEQKRRDMTAKGIDMINLSVGTPDFPPDEHVMQAVSEAARDPKNYRYALIDMPELVSAVQRWYARRYGVALEPNEITSVNGSQEGIAHIAFSLIDPGDTVIVTNPGYPIFAFGPMLAGAELYEAPITADTDFLIDFSAIPEDIAKKAKLIICSYPSNPVTAAAPKSFYEGLVSFAKKYNIMVVHDNAYSEIVFGDKPGISFLSIEGAKDVGIEFNSLSKSYNLTGCRISFALGNSEMIARFKKLRSQIDYGIFLPVQYGAIAALDGSQEICSRIRAGYKARMNALCGGLRSIGWPVPDSIATMFVWAPLPAGFDDSTAFSLELMERAHVMCTPGIEFGELGSGYVRFALTVPEERMAEAVRRIDECGILKT